MRLKMTPDDFVVNEVVSIDTKAAPGKAKYRIYLMEKSGWNTLDAISSIASASRVDPSLVGYAGLKDRHARTTQHISVPAQYELTSRRDDIRLTFLGFSDDFVSTKVLVGNRFMVRVGGLGSEEAGGILSRAQEIRRHGYPNYFDDQRFGSVTGSGEFVAERIVRGHLKGALKIHLSEVFPNQKKAERERRAKVSAAWGKWDEVFELCESREDRAVAAPLLGGATKKHLLLALSAIPHEAMARYIAAYQAFVWNEVLRRIVKGSGVPFREVPGKAGPYLFPTKPISDPGLDIPAVAAVLAPCRPEIACRIDEVLSERGLTLADFNVRGLRSRYFKSFSRRAWVIPDGLVVGEPKPDRDNPSQVELRISFALPAGSYATMLLKALAVSTSPLGCAL